MHSSRYQKEIGQAIEYASQQPLPHWSLNQHEHRQELTRIMHVKANKVKAMKSYVTAEILEVSAHRARLIKTKRREEQ